MAMVAILTAVGLADNKWLDEVALAKWQWENNQANCCVVRSQIANRF